MAKRVKSSALFLVAGAFALLAIALVAGRYISVFSASVVADQEKWGQFGDYFGGILNPILSFFAFLAVLYTLHEQKRSGEESVREGRLFHLLSSNVEILRSMEIRQIESGTLKVYEGALASDFIWLALNQDHLERAIGTSDAEKLSFARRGIRQVKTIFWPAISCYFDSVASIVTYVSEQKAGRDFDLFALTTLKSQMTVRSRSLLFYIMLDSEHLCKFIPVLMAVGFWEDATEDNLAGHRYELYAAAAVFHQA
ncbi:hypothetical protein LF844_09690 [Metapseudomonas lalkuanensis]|uniref:hypothetical protein n=1 Tax=Metapseudomonas lalkuanensis TaxID=2604832 RepID=UPI001CF364CD|nr:hypothetical protein [Pseudomonas lalkuanensis]UCP00061.1 hypothetical protein LF844_09690 [Pseudomonas lalkuanensis]